MPPKTTNEIRDSESCTVPWTTVHPIHESNFFANIPKILGSFFKIPMAVRGYQDSNYPAKLDS